MWASKSNKRVLLDTAIGLLPMLLIDPESTTPMSMANAEILAAVCIVKLRGSLVGLKVVLPLNTMPVGVVPL